MSFDSSFAIRRRALRVYHIAPVRLVGESGMLVRLGGCHEAKNAEGG